MATATIVFFSECCATRVTAEEIHRAADGLELKLNEYRLTSSSEADARRLLSYYYCGLMAKYRPLVEHRKALKHLETKYVALMQRK